MSTDEPEIHNIDEAAPVRPHRGIRIAMVVLLIIAAAGVAAWRLAGPGAVARGGDVSITVANCSDRDGVGRRAALLLLSAGHRVERLGDADRAPSKETLVIYRGADRAIAEEIASALPVARVKRDSLRYVFPTRILVIVGSDWPQDPAKPQVPPPAARPAPALTTLKQQLLLAYPQWSAAELGIMGDASHRATVSDHNLGNAIDIPVAGGPGAGAPMEGLLLRLLADGRAHYAIYNGIIYHVGSKPEPYTGDSAHANHVHLSIDPQEREDTTPWVLPENPEQLP